MTPYLRLMMFAAGVIFAAGIVGTVVLGTMGFAFALILTAVFGANGFPVDWVVQAFACIGFLFGAGAMVNEMSIPSRWSSFKAHFMY